MGQSLVIVLSISSVKVILVLYLCVLLRRNCHSSVHGSFDTFGGLGCFWDRRATLHPNWSSKYFRQLS